MLRRGSIRLMASVQLHAGKALRELFAASSVQALETVGEPANTLPPEQAACNLHACIPRCAKVSDQVSHSLFLVPRKRSVNISAPHDYTPQGELEMLNHIISISICTVLLVLQAPYTSLQGQATLPGLVISVVLS